MKKTSTIVTERELYEMSVLIGNIGYIKSKSGRTGLINIKTGQMIDKLDYYYTIYDEKNKIYIQENKISNSETEEKKTVMNIYDAMNEQYIVQNYEFVKYFDKYQQWRLLKSIDGKLHLFNASAYRKGTGIFHLSLDAIDHFIDIYNYFIITVNGKKGLYCEKGGLLTDIEYDDIERKENVTIYTKGGKKYFECSYGKGGLIGGYDKIIEDEEKPILYCFNGNIVQAIHKQYGYLLLEEKAEEITCLNIEESSYSINKEWYFKITIEGISGLYRSSINHETRHSKTPNDAEVQKLTDIKYDEITYENSSGTFYLKKSEKIGLLKNNILLEPKWDKIVYLSSGYYAFYKGRLCDIALPSKIVEPAVTRCQITAEINDGIIYQKGNQFGVFIPDYLGRNSTTLEAEYDSIEPLSELNKYHFKLEKNGKVGLFDGKKVILPPKYESFNFKCYKEEYGEKSVVYFVLEEGGSYQLAKRKNYSYMENGEIEFLNNRSFENIELLPDMMMLQDHEKTYLYNYQEELLKTFDGKISISAFPKNKDYPSKGYLYMIDGVCYFYENGKFERVLTEEVNYYTTTYENGTDIFEARTLDLKEHDAFCSQIDALEEKEAETTLIELSQNKQLVKSKFPTLQFERIPKTKE